jgi:hypothetical protein
MKAHELIELLSDYVETEVFTTACINQGWDKRTSITAINHVGYDKYGNLVISYFDNLVVKTREDKDKAHYEAQKARTRDTGRRSPKGPKRSQSPSARRTKRKDQSPSPSPTSGAREFSSIDELREYTIKLETLLEEQGKGEKDVSEEKKSFN